MSGLILTYKETIEQYGETPDLSQKYRKAILVLTSLYQETIPLGASISKQIKRIREIESEVSRIFTKYPELDELTEKCAWEEATISAEMDLFLARRKEILEEILLIVDTQTQGINDLRFVHGGFMKIARLNRDCEFFRGAFRKQMKQMAKIIEESDFASEGDKLLLQKWSNSKNAIATDIRELYRLDDKISKQLRNLRKLKYRIEKRFQY